MRNILRRLSDGHLRDERLLAVSLLVVVVTAVRSVTFFHPDEHFQILEFAGLKLGFTPASALPWEFAAGIRPFLQPALCFGVIRVLQTLGMNDRFAFACVLRLLFGALYWLSVVLLCQTQARGSTSDSQRRPPYWVLFTGFLPYLAVRTSSETFSAALFTLGTVLVLPKPAAAAKNRAAPQRLTLSGKTALAAGALLGLAFEARYQTAIMTLGLAGWLAYSRVSRTAWPALAVGFTLALALGAACDRWGYGHWCFPPAAYFKANLLNGVAKQYGTSPVFAYLYLPVANLFAPVVVLLILGLMLTWVRYPGHLVTWVALPFVVIHSLLAHKEERFLFPIIPFALLALDVGFRPRLEAESGTAQPSHESHVASWLTKFKSRAESVAAWFWTRSRGRAAQVTLGANFLMMLLLAVYPLGWRPHHALYQWLDTRFPQGAHLLVLGEPYPDYPFFRSAPWQQTVSERGVPVSLAGRAAEDPFLVVRDTPFCPALPAEFGAARKRLLYSEFPGYQFDWVQRWVFPRLGRLLTTAQGNSSIRTRWYSVYSVEVSSAP
jgi:GPI mannosyltransferase 3